MSGAASKEILPTRRRPFCWRPFISFQDTNLVGNVYFSHFVGWQGRCREAFLAEHAPDVIDALTGNLRLVTLSVSCEFYDELHVFDSVELEMRLASREHHRIGLTFEYLLERKGVVSLAARGAQEIACMQIDDSGRLTPAIVPSSLDSALKSYAEAG